MAKPTRYRAAEALKDILTPREAGGCDCSCTAPGAQYLEANQLFALSLDGLRMTCVSARVTSGPSWACSCCFGDWVGPIGTQGRREACLLAGGTDRQHRGPCGDQLAGCRDGTQTRSQTRVRLAGLVEVGTPLSRCRTGLPGWRTRSGCRCKGLRAGACGAPS